MYKYLSMMGWCDAAKCKAEFILLLQNSLFFFKIKQLTIKNNKTKLNKQLNNFFLHYVPHPKYKTND